MINTPFPTATDLRNRVGSVRQPTDVDAHVGMRLRSLREAAGFTQAELAEQMGFSFQQLQKYERGINRVSASRLVEFANVLKVPLASFFEGVGTGFTADDEKLKIAVGIVSSDPIALELVSAFASLTTDEQRQKAHAAVAALASGT
jgi:transcriptional regulator with XRE-family HTH domain